MYKYPPDGVLSLPLVTSACFALRLTSLATPVPYGLRVRSPYSRRARYVSLYHVCSFWQLLERKYVSAPRLRYPVLNLRHTIGVADSLFFQYYALATGTILFYDHLLTLADEVCQGPSLTIS